MPRRTKPIIHRKNTTAFVDEIPENTTAICNKCYENDIETILVAYPKDSHFLQCPYCSTIVNRNYAKHKSFFAPLGSIEGISNPTFEVVGTRRHGNLSKTGNELFDPNDYPMCQDGTPDSDLTYYSSMGQVTRIIDDDTGEEEL